MAYVEKNSVFIFPGEHFGIRVKANNDEISQVAYEKDAGKADVEFKFSAQGQFMMLTIENRLNHTLYLDAGMRIPKRSEFFKTTILPVRAKLAGFESWPHPIFELVLRNIRFQPKVANRAVSLRLLALRGIRE